MRRDSMMKLWIGALVAIGIVCVSGCGNGIATASAPGAGATTAQQSAPGAGPALSAAVDPDEAAAAAYCRQTHGEVEIRHAVYGSNGSTLLFLAGVRRFCQYTRKKDGSRIHILLSTLYTTKPTLAALAYYLKPPVGSCGGNPASCYCSSLGGSDQFRRNNGRRRRMVQEKLDRSNAGSLYLPRYVFDRFVGLNVPRKRHHSRHQPREGDAL